jgi:hypothetical protein
MVSPRRLVALGVLLVASVFWTLSILSATKGGFFENEWAVQMMVLGGAISMVAGAIAEFW